MAVNVSLTSGPSPRNRDGNALVPAPYAHEVFVLRRDDMELELKDSTGVLVPSLKGSLHMTNVRLVFVVGERHGRRSRFRSVEVPFRGLERESLHQPIFGANNLTGDIIPYDDQPLLGDISFKLVFKNGGLGTFLPIFNYILGNTRRYTRELARERRELARAREREQQTSVTSSMGAPTPDTPDGTWTAGLAARPPPPPSQGGSDRSEPVFYGVDYSADQFRTAMYDPSDPSEIYLFQPDNTAGSAPPSHFKRD